MTIDLTSAKWINEPKLFKINNNTLKIVTEPDTDFWQRSYYGFRNDNAPALLLESKTNFSFTSKVSFNYKNRFDQCGVIIYLDSDNWFFGSIEFENNNLSRLGSVVTNKGYSDWATTDIASANSIWYRLSRRGPDFLIEFSTNGTEFKQMRVFHLHCLGETSAQMGKLNPPAQTDVSINFGLYACSPTNSSFEAAFDNLKLEECLWQAH